MDPPFGVLDWAALRANADDLVRRAGGVPIRLAPKSVRVRQVLTEMLSWPGCAGLLPYPLSEALWLHAGGRPHWGKLPSLTAEQLRPRYPDVRSRPIGPGSRRPRQSFRNWHFVRVLGLRKLTPTTS